MTFIDAVRRNRQIRLEQSIRELEALADLHSGSSHYLSEQAFKFGLKYAIRNIEETELLHIKAMKELPFSNPKEAQREHENLMNVLAVLKRTLVNRYEAKP